MIGDFIVHVYLVDFGRCFLKEFGLLRLVSYSIFSDTYLILSGDLH